jgi:hypothetical protein
MSTVEVINAKRRQKRNLKYAVLVGTKIMTEARVILRAQQMPKTLERLGLLSLSYTDTSTIARTKRELIQQGYLKEEKGKLRLTKKGTTALSILEARQKLKKQRRWDGRWRVLIFDVPEYRKTVRDKIRHTLHDIGFFRLQDSVWIYPYDCEDFITLLKADLKIGKDVLYMIVDELEGDRRIREQFGL